MTFKFALLLVGTLSASAQQQFQNLDFESATVTPTQSGGPVPVSEGLPDWTVYFGSEQQSQVLYNYAYLSLATVDILGPGWGPNVDQPEIIGGQSSVYLQSGMNPNDGTPTSASIAQTGALPANAESLQFKAWQTFGGPFSVSFAGNNLPLVLLSTAQAPSGQQYDVYGADISAYAGQTGQLEFTELLAPNSSGLSLLLDDITFSTSSAPEPSSALLAALGGLLFAIFRRRIPSR